MLVFVFVVLFGIGMDIYFGNGKLHGGVEWMRGSSWVVMTLLSSTRCTHTQVAVFVLLAKLSVLPMFLLQSLNPEHAVRADFYGYVAIIQMHARS
jgi:hypothetical protein